ncbi:histidine kinase [Acrocarpospora pleiomorpha]|uniref:histidine kinase n=2 Tax=Acrocarpospora pleiomorpha TaxID=90975 RepID=UPI0012D2AEF4
MSKRVRAHGMSLAFGGGGSDSPQIPRWMAQVVVSVLAVFLAVIVWHVLVDDYGVRNVSAATLGLAVAISVVLSRFQARLAWWLSLAAAVLSAVVSHDALQGAVWPAPVLAAHAVVLALVGFEARVRLLVEMWVLTLMAGVALWALLPGEQTLIGLGDMSLLSGMALTTVYALRRAALADRRTKNEQARSALLAERTRIARELHDVVAHHMSVVAVQAEAAPYRVPDPPPELARSFATIRASAVEALTELHRVLGLLRNDTSDESSPQPTLDRLRELVGRVEAAGTPVTLRIEGRRRSLPSGVELSAYRIVQEALSNALQHAQGAELQVQVTYGSDVLDLRVENGQPATPPRPSTRPGHGLLGMRERVAMLNGELTAGPRAGGGYALTVRLPLVETEDT